MNNTELRQQLKQLVLQDPSIESPEVNALIQQDAEFKQFVSQVRQQQQQLEQALRITAPTELASELLQLANKSKAKTPWLINLAVAASLALVSILSVVVYTNYQHEDMASHVLAHVHEEANFVDSHLVQQPLTEVNTKLASFNISLQDWAEEIIYARFCTFKGVRSLHLAIRTDTGYATVFIVPKDSQLDLIANFSDTDYQGLSFAMAQANLVIVSREPADLNVLPQKLLANLRVSA
ncbi:DUF3379 family protein [Rheinheimera salexigens]|uniref:DUF3379 domain-containing protein n=1 Tax=Rheinheimera salexigens TaxID=1628148 RepID=A0A1E7Q997_9GAMM|nr:DUF3379 family protein [Rheinheimera salexigens]OEY70633.1 hypothetical protein BI198_14465 [Rheinheimera salexigens]